MRSESPYSEVPELLQAFAPEYRSHHYHMPEKADSWQVFKSVFLDEHHGPNSLAKKVIKGALLGANFGIVMKNFVFRGPKSFEMDRLWMLGRPNKLIPLRGYIGFGAVMGGVWWIIKDVICMPHGTDNRDRHNYAYALMGGVLFASIVNPANFIYGCLTGYVIGNLKQTLELQSLPPGMQWKLKNVDEEKRRKLLREDEEFELSGRHSLTTRHNLYPL